MTLQNLHTHIATLAQREVEAPTDTSKALLTFSGDPAFGDVTTNIAMIMAGQAKIAPRALAERIAATISAETPEVVRVEVAGPGFLNIWLQDDVVSGLVKAATTVKIDDYAHQKVLVEYSDPNPFKPLHAGHLYTTLVGDMLARLVDRGGADVVRLNYGGDVGLHVARSMWAMVKYFDGERPEALDNVPAVERAAWMGDRYVQGTAAYEDDPEARAEIIAMNKRVYEIQSTGDKTSSLAKMYWTCRTWSYDYFAELYRQLEVVPFDRFIPESEVTALGIQTVRDQQKAGVYEESEGAVIFDGERVGLHKRVFINSAGLPTYEAKDVGLLLTKWRDYHFDRSVVITAREQEEYMRVMLASVHEFAPEPAEKSEHLVHGAVKLQGGVKMSSRRGNVVMAMDILAAAREAAEASGLGAREESVLGAVKYSFAKIRMGGDLIYDPIESVALEGNSGPYLQYAHARARSILMKLGGNHQIPVKADFEPAERALALKVAEYDVVLRAAVRELMPHQICTYLYEVAQVFNRFYEGNRVAGSDREALRAGLVASYAAVLKDGLTMLGIAAPERL